MATNDSTNLGQDADRASHRFSADRPIQSTAEDLLGRAPFAQALAQAIRGWRGNDSLVIALYGPWGSGKSSIKNMALESLRDDPGDATTPVIVEFNPWEWSGQHRLMEAFFEEIGVRLEEEGGSKIKQLARLWRHWSRRTIAIIKTTPFLSALMHWGLSKIGLSDLPIGAIFCRKSLAELKTEMRKSLAGLDRCILVVLDDIDRLTPEEIRLLFQLVKANADFPKMIYLLLFQRDIVERSLDPEAISGSEFLEKIVQVGFDIPQIERTRLKNLLLDKLEALIHETDSFARFDRDRFRTLFSWGLWPYFSTLRDVYRFLNTLSFQFARFVTPQGFEANPVDLIALEVLRLFEPEVYKQIPYAKSALLKMPDVEERPMLDRGEERRRRLEELIASAKNKISTQNILAELFPTARRAFSPIPDHTPDYPDWYRELRICHSDVFDRYFLLRIPERDIPQWEIDRLASLAGDRNALVTEFHGYMDRGQLDVLLDRWNTYRPAIDPHALVPFTTALLDIADDVLPQHEHGEIWKPTAWNVFNVIAYYLQQVQDHDQQVQILREAFPQTQAVWFPISLIDELETSARNPNGGIRLVDRDFAELKRLCIDKIDAAARDAKLSFPPRIFYILKWQEWSASPEQVREWVEQFIQPKEGLLAFLNACIIPSLTANRDRVREEWRMGLQAVEQIIPLDRLEQRIRQLDGGELSEVEQRIVHTFLEALEDRRHAPPAEETNEASPGTTG